MSPTGGIQLSFSFFVFFFCLFRHLTHREDKNVCVCVCGTDSLPGQIWLEAILQDCHPCPPWCTREGNPWY
uniref:Putative secreted protein n=1 Tax=Anopheles darlingi TaxID=43151 RepID=A0A2M4DB60_ANODA